MDAPIIAIVMLIAFILLGMLATAFGADSRDGFSEDTHPGLTV